MSGWWENAVIYEIYPRSFQDSDGDGIGDLAGIEKRLDHLVELGADGLWLAPIYRSPQADFGYDVSDHTSIAPEYGTDAELDSLLEAAHGRGLRVLMDLVASHTSIEHPWFREHPDRYVLADPRADGALPNNWVASFGGPTWSRDENSGRLYLHSFFAEQPDLDWRNPAVRKAMGAVVTHWLERGVDGFRIDAVDRLMKDEQLRDDPASEAPFELPVHPDGQMLELIHSRDDPGIGTALAALREAAGEAPLVGEVYLPGPRLDPYLEQLDLVFCFDLLHAPWEADALAEVLEAAAGREQLAWVISNHDFSRAATRWGEANARAAAMLLLTLPGCAFLYQGEEIGMVDGPGSEPPLDRFGRDAFRHPMQWDGTAGGGFSEAVPWLPLADPGVRNVGEQRDDPGSMLALYRALIAARGGLAGPLTDVRANRGLLSYRRGEHHRVVLNTGEAGQSLGSVIDLGRAEPALATGVEGLRDGTLGAGDGVLLRTNV